MKLRDLFAATAVVALTAAPVAAQAASAAELRSGTPVEGEELGGGLLLPLIGIIAIIAAIVLVTDDGDDEPASP